MKRIIIFLMASVLLLAGCSESKTNNTSSEIFYVGQDGCELFSTFLSEDSSGTGSLLNMLTNALNEGTGIPNECLSLKDYGISIEKVNQNGNLLNVTLNSAFNKLSNTDKLLVIAVITKTYCQDSDILSVKFYIGNKAVADSDGKEMPAFKESSFVDDAGDSIKDYTKTDMTLYFASADGDKLVPETREVYYSTNTPLEQVVVNELIDGPDEMMLNPVLSSDVNVLNVTIQDDVCYVNFDDTFLNQSLNLDPNLQIYAIVNSICDACNINKVSFSVNGSNEIIYKDTVDLSQVFNPDLTFTED